MLSRFILLLFICLVWLSSNYCYGQKIIEMKVVYQEVNEPPRRPGPMPQTITYKQKAFGDFVVAKAKGFTRKDKAAIKKSVLNKEAINKLNTWLLQKKRVFSLSDLEIKASDLNLLLEKKPLLLTKQVEDGLLLSPDSSTFCIANAWSLSKTMMIGGYVMEVSLTRQNGDEEAFAFNSPIFMSHEIDLVSYFTIAPVLIKYLPGSFSAKGLFTKEKLLEGIIYHLRFAECEGFYYDEFIRENPDRTSAQNRAKEGWDLAEYLKTRNRK